MKPVILLGIDGVLNPAVRPGPGGRTELIISGEKVALVRRLARCGPIVWVSTWPADMTAGLDSQLRLGVDPLRVTLLLSPEDGEQRTPKLRPVTRWLARMEATGEADWDVVVWMDDVFGPDAREWAHHYGRPVLLEKPAPGEGLAEVHVVAVEVLLED